jgi:hypothetical protein
MVFASGLLLPGAQQEELTEEPVRPAITAGDCSFLSNPDDFKIDAETRYITRSDITKRISKYRSMAMSLPDAVALDSATVPRKTFIDDAIFGRMAAAGIQSAPLASDAEFLRRVTLDLTGRIPSADDLNAFLADTNPSKRDIKVDQLIGTPEFVDKWTMFFGDLFKVNAQATNINRELQGRDAFYAYVKGSVSINKPYDLMARELISATGDSFVAGEVNWSVGNTVAMGPQQDTFDGQAANLASMFMGINAVDCLLCHDGARHLDQVNLWGAGQTRRNMWGLSAFFTRVRMQRQVVSQTPRITKTIVSDQPAGTYNLNTTIGNRTARQPINGVRSIAASNPFASVAVTSVGTIGGGSILAGETYRQAIARQITSDPQFARAAVNYIWEKFMVEAFVSPSNSFDLARLDPAKPPAAPWTLQPTNPELLNALAVWFEQNRYDLRALMALIAKSNAYQLSAAYPGTWDISYVPYYARRFVRRLDAEEIHDAITTATGILPTYTFNAPATLPPVQWAMQLPDTREPRSNGQVVTFLTAFGRGDRDTSFRRSDGSALQALTMMNNNFVMNRIHQANAGSRVQTLLAQNAGAETIIEQLFLNTLSRPATSAEIALFTPMFQQQGNRLAAEGLQWMLLNKMDFMFNY